MASPWLDIPLADYESHMEHVGQARMLGEVLGHALRVLQPQSVAVLGAAGGNGFEHLVAAGVSRTVAIDINPLYLRQLERRFLNRVQALEVVCGDLDDAALSIAPVDLVHAALIFEYVDAAKLLARARTWLRPGGALWVVLQVPDERRSVVSASPFTRLSALAGFATLRDEHGFRKAAVAAGFAETSSEVVTLPDGKRFFSGCYSAGGFGRPG